MILELGEVIKPTVDDRLYRLITLTNGLDVLLISDPTTDKSSAAIDVNVGHLCDPEDVPGLAHFCEHLLFMGTEKYPIENEYSSFLSAHGGTSNAFTGAENTNYYFDIAANYLQPALDRFAQFFIAPLFNASGTDREMNAVDSEHKKNIQSDMWRLYQLDKDLSSPDHPYIKFGTGDINTLKHAPLAKGIDIRKVLLDFHSKYYSSNIMKLVILGKESLDELTAWAVELFSGIENKQTKIPSFPGHPLTSTQVFVKPVKEIRSLNLVFPFPDLDAYYKTQPGAYIGHLIGHESKGSILSLLKKKNWASGLSSHLSRGGIGFEFFKISVELTEEGEENYEEIILIIFQFIKMIKAQGVEQWIFDEVATISKTSFMFKEKMRPSDYCSNVAGNLHSEPKTDVLCRDYLLSVFDRDIIDRMLDLLIPENFRLTFISPEFDTEDFETAPHYGTRFTVMPFSDEFKLKLSNVESTPELHLPERNIFVAQDFTVERIESESPAKVKILVESKQMRLWYKKDDTFHVPKAHVHIQFMSPQSYVNVKNCVLSKLVVEVLKESLNEFSYHAEVAGLEFSLDSNTDGLLLHIGGYNDKLGLLLHEIIAKLSALEFTQELFDMVKDELKRKYKNWQMESPHQHAMFFGSLLTQEMLWKTSDKLKELDACTYENVKTFAPDLIAQLHIEGLIHGNVDTKVALKWSESLVETLNYKPLTDAQFESSIRTHWIPQGHHIFSSTVSNPSNVNSAIEYYLQIGEDSDMNRALLILLAQITSEPCFDQLRTKEQLGYMVFSGVRKQTSMIGFRIIIQSEKSPIYLESRIELFLDTLGETLRNMSAEEFTKNATALSVKLVEKDKNLGQEVRGAWAKIASRVYDFDQNKRDSVNVLAITQQEMNVFFEAFIANGSATRRKLSVHMVSQKIDGDALVDEVIEAINAKNVFVNEDELLVFKAGLALGEGSKAYSSIASYFDHRLAQSDKL